MKPDEISPELRAFLESRPVLSPQDIAELGDAISALNYDPEFVADCIKSDFVSDILGAMADQDINKNQLAEKWGKSRQHVGNILDKEKAKNFTIDTIVSLSMTLGLMPQRLSFKKMYTTATAMFSAKYPSESDAAPIEWRENSKALCPGSMDLASAQMNEAVVSGERPVLLGFVA